jgi:hypothetical protein
VVRKILLLFALIALVAAVVGVWVYLFEESLGNWAILSAEVAATLLVFAIVSWKIMRS